jgi:superfamily I DNA/RNA helicase
LLIQILEQLAREGYTANDIVLLSPRADASSAAAALTNSAWRTKLQPYGGAMEGVISYCSVYAFKGMEAPVVVVTDIDQIGGDREQALFYVAITRSLHRLVLLMHTATRKEILSLLAPTSS